MDNYRVFCFLLGYSVLTLAAEEVVLKPQSIIFQQDAVGQLRLQVNQAQLPTVLKVISDKTEIAIHYTVLPEAPVSALCIGQSIKDVLECLFADSVDMVFRYPESLAELQAPVEVWLLGSSLVVPRNYTANCTATINQLGLKAEKSRDTAQHDSKLKERLDFRMQMLISGTPLQRSQAISYLAVHMPLEENSFQTVLENALTDESAKVRAQAISALVRRQGELDSLPELLQAIQDSDVSVRLMALGQVKETRALVQQALDDENKLVRQFAVSKLQDEELLRQ